MGFPLKHSDENVVILPGAQVMGDVSFGPGCSVWYNAVLRSDGNPIKTGANCNFQDCVILHAGERPITIGDNVTVGHGAIVHGCTVGNDCLIGMGAILLNDVVIGNNCLVAAGALVTSRTVVPDGSLVMGNPATVRRPLTDAELESIRHGCRHYLDLKEVHR